MYPYLFEGTPYQFNSWSAAFVVGLIISLTWGLIARPKDFPYTRLQMFLAVVCMFFFGFIGSRILFIALYWEGIKASGDSLIGAFIKGGNASLGGLAVIFIVIFAFTKLRRKKVSFLVATDYALPFIALHTGIARIGCFLAGCCVGRPTDLPWGCRFLTFPNETRHPTQLYLTFSLLFVFFTARYVYKKKYPPGITSFYALGMYALLRYFVEQLRIDSVAVWGAVTLSQLTMLSIFLFCIFMLLIILLRSNKHNTA